MYRYSRNYLLDLMMKFELCGLFLLHARDLVLHDRLERLRQQIQNFRSISFDWKTPLCRAYGQAVKALRGGYKNYTTESIWFQQFLAKYIL